MKGTIPETVTVVDVSSYGTGANVGAGTVSEDPIAQTYALVTFSYSALQIGANAVKAGVPGTPEEQAHALEVFKASVPSLVETVDEEPATGSLSVSQTEIGCFARGILCRAGAAPRCANELRHPAQLSEDARHPTPCSY